MQYLISFLLSIAQNHYKKDSLFVGAHGTRAPLTKSDPVTNYVVYIILEELQHLISSL